MNPDTITDYRQAKYFIRTHAIAQLLRQTRDQRIITYWAINGYVWIEDEVTSHPAAPYCLRSTNIAPREFLYHQ